MYRGGGSLGKHLRRLRQESEQVPLPDALATFCPHIFFFSSSCCQSASVPADATADAPIAATHSDAIDCVAASPVLKAIVLVGVSGSGKTTFASTECCSSVQVCRQFLRRRKNFSRDWKEAQLIKQWLGKDRNIVVDAPHLRRDARLRIVDVIKQSAREQHKSVHISAYVFEPDLEVALS